MTAYKATWWHDCGAFSDIFDTLAEARQKLNRECDMGAYKTLIEEVPE